MLNLVARGHELCMKSGTPNPRIQRLLLFTQPHDLVEAGLRVIARARMQSAQAICTSRKLDQNLKAFSLRKLTAFLTYTFDVC